jgi:hypothetical protein
MYSTHNFYFKPLLLHLHSCRSSIVRVTKRKGLSNGKHLLNIVRITHLPTPLTLRTQNAIAERIAYCSPGFVCLLLRERSWTTHPPNDTPERERSLLGRRSQVMSPNTFSIISSG